jgi:hypothetical protein
LVYAVHNLLCTKPNTCSHNGRDEGQLAIFPPPGRHTACWALNKYGKCGSAVAGVICTFFIQNIVLAVIPATF